jgi:prevent-host-death family protein
MRTVGLFEARQKLSELVERANGGERVGITRRGKLIALIVPAPPVHSLTEIFDRIERIRKRAKRHTISVKDLIEEGPKLAPFY